MEEQDVNLGVPAWFPELCTSPPHWSYLPKWLFKTSSSHRTPGARFRRSDLLSIAFAGSFRKISFCLLKCYLHLPRGGRFLPTELLKELKAAEHKLVDYMLYEEIILFSQRRESWPSEPMMAGNKLSGFPFCSATSGTFYQSGPAGKDFVFLPCNLILSSVELRCILNAKPSRSVSINLYPPGGGLAFV